MSSKQADTHDSKPNYSISHGLPDVNFSLSCHHLAPLLKECSFRSLVSMLHFCAGLSPSTVSLNTTELPVMAPWAPCSNTSAHHTHPVTVTSTNSVDKASIVEPVTVGCVGAKHWKSAEAAQESCKTRTQIFASIGSRETSYEAGGGVHCAASKLPFCTLKVTKLCGHHNSDSEDRALSGVPALSHTTYVLGTVTLWEVLSISVQQRQRVLLFSDCCDVQRIRREPGVVPRAALKSRVSNCSNSRITTGEHRVKPQKGKFYFIHLKMMLGVNIYPQIFSSQIWKLKK